MDYDLTNIPAGYDRGRDHGPEVLNLWMSVIESRVEVRSVRTILDLGCGTGRFSECLASRFGACVVGVDPSAKMLEQARQKQQDAFAKSHYPQGAQLCSKCSTAAVVMMDGCMTCLNCGDSKCG